MTFTKENMDSWNCNFWSFTQALFSWCSINQCWKIIFPSCDPMTCCRPFCSAPGYVSCSAGCEPVVENGCVRGLKPAAAAAAAASPYMEKGMDRADVEPITGRDAIFIFSSSASCSRFDFARRFWNQILTWVSVRLRDVENSARSAIERYWRSRNFRSRARSCWVVNGVRGFRFDLCLRSRHLWGLSLGGLSNVAPPTNNNTTHNYSVCIHMLQIKMKPSSLPSPLV